MIVRRAAVVRGAAACAFVAMAMAACSGSSTENEARIDVTVEQSAEQVDPASTMPLLFTVTFDEEVEGFDATDLSFTGTTAPGTPVVNIVNTGPIPNLGPVFTVEVSGLTGPGDVRMSVPAGRVTTVDGVSNRASTSADNTIDYAGDFAPPQVVIDQHPTQEDPTTERSLRFRATFSERVQGFTAGDVAFTGTTTPGPFTVTVTGELNGAVYTVAVAGMSASGQVALNIPANRVTDFAGHPNGPSTSNDNTINYVHDTDPPGVSIDQAAAQVDPFAGSPILFTVTFTEPVLGFSGADISFAGSTVGGALVATVTGAGPTYTVSVTGMAGSGTVVASVPAGRATDRAGNANTASISVDNVVTRP